MKGRPSTTAECLNWYAPPLDNSKSPFAVKFAVGESFWLSALEKIEEVRRVRRRSEGRRLQHLLSTLSTHSKNRALSGTWNVNTKHPSPPRPLKYPITRWVSLPSTPLWVTTKCSLIYCMKHPTWKVTRAGQKSEYQVSTWLKCCLVTAHSVGPRDCFTSGFLLRNISSKALQWKTFQCGPLPKSHEKQKRPIRMSPVSSDV